jgi:hypothetical protein
VSEELDLFAVPGVDELFDAALADFIAGRDELVKELKKQGDKAAAAAVKALRKPSTVAWAVNQVARRDGDDIDALLEAARAVRAAQVKAVRGEGDGGLRNASREWRAVIQSLASSAAAFVGDQYRDEAAATFEAASADDELASMLRNGRLSAAVSPGGFGLAGMPEPLERRSAVDVAGFEPESRPRVKGDADAAETADAPEAVAERDERRIAAAQKHLDEREAALEKATLRLRRAEQRLDVAQQAVDDANEARDKAMAARDEAAAALRAV